MPARNNLVYTTGCVLALGSFLDWKKNTHHKQKVIANNPLNSHPIGGFESTVLAQWIGIFILTFVLALTIEQAPEFGTPLTLLILVAAGIKYEPALAWGWNQIGKA